MKEQDRRFVGSWWRAGSREHAVGGVLEIDEAGRCRLELVDSLLEHHETQVLLHGKAFGKSITVINASPSNGGKTVIGQEHTETQVLRSDAVLVGIHLESADDAVFDAMWVSIANLTTWADRSAFEAIDTYDKDLWKFRRAEFKYEPIDDIAVALTDRKEEIIFRWCMRGNTIQNYVPFREYRVREAVRLEVRAGEPRSWMGYWRTACDIQDLLTIATQAPCLASSLELKIVRDEGPAHKVDVHFHSGRTAVNAEATRDKTDSHGLLFRLGDLEIAAGINRWIKLTDTLGLPLNVLLGLDYDPSGYYENQIFNAASAAEGFHQALRPNSVSLDPSVHASIVDEVKDHFKDDDLKWILPRVGENRPGLKDRYVELAGIPDSEAVNALVCNVEVWARWLKNARNAIGHLNTGELDRKVPESARFRITYITKALLHLVVMNEIGVDAEKQREAVRNAWWFSAKRFEEAVRAAI
ncbi:ApeA N-terminal domain 1-containing protein [Gordonia sp. NPDC003424]